MYNDKFERCVRTERVSQDNKWGIQEHGALLWLGILAEEFGELAKEVIESEFTAPCFIEEESEVKKLKMERELIQVAAVAKAMWESGKRRGWL